MKTSHEQWIKLLIRADPNQEYERNGTKQRVSRAWLHIERDTEGREFGTVSYQPRHAPSTKHLTLPLTEFVDTYSPVFRNPA